MATRQQVNDVEPDVVARSGVLLAGIAESDDQKVGGGAPTRAVAAGAEGHLLASGLVGSSLDGGVLSG